MPTNRNKAKPADRKVSVRAARRAREAADIARLTAATTDPNAIECIPDLTTFSQIPLSELTQKGLAKSNFLEMTKIQRASLPFTLCGKDVLGAAKTGSGKTLAFLIPILEVLYRASWSQTDGLGALVISPTRELAMQIFEVLRHVGRFHSFSAGLLIGGKEIRAEQERVGRMNILVCTPGRLLQHMDQTPEFTCDNLQILVLDEADRILDSGFERTLNAIIANLPKTRQTLLFSATQTKSVRDLARLSLHDPEYVSVHESAEHSTPVNLTQKYVVIPLHQKLDVLFSFLRTHVKQKTLVFLSSCKQVRFVFETFCKMQPGVPLMCLHGKQKQAKRMAIFEQFCRKQNACLFATDIAARGLDFPAVHWVIQVDCPEDAETYIHRVGRTARYESVGHALMFLLPSEAPAMVESLHAYRVPIEETKINPSKTTSVQPQLAALCSQSPDIKYLGQKAFVCYLRSIYLQSNKKVFDVSQLPVDEFAEALGLPGAPKIKFVKRGAAIAAAAAKTATSAEKEKKNAIRRVDAIGMDDDDEDGDGTNKAALAGKVAPSNKSIACKNFADDDDDDDDSDAQSKKQKEDSKKPRTKIDRMFAKKNLTVLSEHYAKLKDQSDDDVDNSDDAGENVDTETTTQVSKHNDDDDDDIFTLKRADHALEDIDLPSTEPRELTHRRILRERQKAIKARGSSNRLIFDDDGTPIHAFKMETLDEFAQKQDIESRQQQYLDSQTLKMRVDDSVDRGVARDRLRERKRLRKLREKLLRRDESGVGDDGGVAVLANPDDDSVDNNDSDSDDRHSDTAYNSHDDDDDDDDTSIHLERNQSPKKSHRGSKRPASRSNSDSEHDGSDNDDDNIDYRAAPVKRSRTSTLETLNKDSLEEFALRLLNTS